MDNNEEIEQIVNNNTEEPEIVEEDNAVEPIDVEKLSPKAKKLIEKVDKLCEKISQEKNPLKLQFLKFQVRGLQTKIQNELDLINLKQSYELKREELKNIKTRKDADNEIEIARLANQIKAKRQLLASNSECDYGATDFMYDNDTILRHGGLENLVKTLKGNGNIDVQETGKRIEAMVQARKELAELKKQYKEKQTALANSKEEYDSETKTLDFEEKRLTVIKKYNIFSRIGDFFKNIGVGIKDVRDNMAEAKKLKEEYKQEEAQAKLEYEERMAAIAKKREEAKKQQTDKSNSRFLKDVKLTGKALEEANAPVHSQEQPQQEAAPVQAEVQPEEQK